MPVSAPRIATKFLTSDDQEPVDDGASTSVTAGQFVDMAVFFLAMDSYQKLKGDEDAHLKKVRALLTRYQSDMADGIEKYLLPLTDESAFARFKSHVNLGVRKTRGIPQARIQAGVLSEMLRALSSRTSTLREVLSDSRAVASAIKVGGVLANDAPASVLNGLAAIAPASRLRATLNWVREAAEFAGASPSSIDLMLTDVSQAQMIGEDIHKVDVQISGADPVSARAAELQGARQGLIADLGSVVESSKDAAVVLSTASAAIAQPLDYATKTARAQRLSPDQERAMMLRGKGIIAAGAGSGKTSVLASKVAYHINELGVPPGAIIATSFSRKSAAELRRRIDKYGADIPASAETGFGTTHSIAGKLMREYGGGGRDGLKSYEHSNAIRLAMEQVQMVGSSGEKPPEPTSMFDGMAATLPEPELVPGLTFKAACELAYQRRRELRNPYLQSFIESYFNPRDQWYGVTMRATKNLTDPRGLSEKQSAVLKDIFAKLDVTYSLRTDPNFMAPPAATQSRRAAEGGKNNKDKGLSEKYTYFSKPANQWFNLGLSLTEEGPNGEKKPIPSGVFKQAITKYKGKAISPSEAWAISNGTPEAAVYAAYEWIKGPDGETEFQGRGDFDDVLLDVSKLMLSNPRILRQVQSRFKVVLVDEAQDLNRCVHGDTKVETPDGSVQIRDIVVGEKVLSLENGRTAYNGVFEKVLSEWGWGYWVHTASGRSLRMSPNHRIFTTPIDGCSDDTTETIHVGGVTLTLTTAETIIPGVHVAVCNVEGISLDEVVSVEKEVGGDYWDIAVENAHNFFGNGILSHNSQHLMFGLITGYVDPTKVPNIANVSKVSELARDDEKMAAETYVFIGDDKQAIYEFRSADPEAFIDMSDLVDGGAGFRTEVLKTNYRSGELIVEAANRLIKHNSKQIPMTCNANPQRVDRGGIEVVRFGAVEGRDMKAPAEWLAAQIAEDMEEGLAGKKGYDAYGVGLRSNAEAYTYGLEMLKKGIPFRSKANFFNDPTTKALVHWLTIADEGLSGDVDRTNNAVLGAVSAPATKLSPVTFADKMGGMATGNYLQWLQTNWRKVYSGGTSWSDLVHTYVQNLNKIAALKGTPAEVVLETVLTLEGFDGRSVKDVLLDRVREDEDALAEIRAESVSGNVTEEDIAEVAFAPLAPLKGLLGARPDLAEAMKYTRQLQAANAKLTAVDDPEAKGVNEPAVTLGTMHSWKGLEVENMFIPLVGGRFPRAGASEEDLASERRLAYVAVTRGENRVVVMDIPTVRMTKQGPIVQKSQFTEELCIPPSNAPYQEREDVAYDESSYPVEDWAGEDDDMGRVASTSPFDEAAMDIYLASRGR